MSIKVITAVLRLAPAVVTPAERLVLYALAWHADEHGRNAWPAVATIARETSLTRRAVQKVLRRLDSKGLVVLQGLSARGSVRYGVELDVLDRERGSQSEGDDRERGSQSGDTSDTATANVVQGGANQVRPTANVVQGGGEPGSPDPSLIRPLTVREEVPRAALRAKRESTSNPDRKEERRTYVVAREPGRNGSAPDAGAAPRASAPPAAPPNPPDDDDANDDAPVFPMLELQRLANALFDELGDDTPIDVLEPAFIARAHIRDGDPLRDHLGAFLYNVLKGRRLIEKHFGRASRCR